MQPSTEVPRARVWRALTRDRGDRATDAVLRASGLLAAAGVAITLLVPSATALVLFVLFTVWTNGPHSPVLPASHEPVLMLYGRLYAPLLVAAIGTAAIVFAEWINYHLYRHATDLPVLNGVRERRAVRWAIGLFRRNPFAAIIVFAVTPIPYWIARVLSVLTAYPVGRHLWATAIGRFPRLWFFAALGGLAIPTRWLVAVALGSVAAAALLAAGRALHARLRRAHRGAAFNRETVCHS